MSDKPKLRGLSPAEDPTARLQQLVQGKTEGQEVSNTESNTVSNIVSHTTVLQADPTDDKTDIRAGIRAAMRPTPETIMKAVTIKLSIAMDKKVEAHCKATGRLKQDVIRDGLLLYFEAVESMEEQ